MTALIGFLNHLRGESMFTIKSHNGVVAVLLSRAGK